MAELTPSGSRKNKSSFSKSINHRSTKVDLTPMVDLGFLLITFFVFTTSMAEPKAMDLLETREGPATPIKNSAAMTIITGKNHKMFYYFGALDSNGPFSQIKKTDSKNLRSLIMDMKRKTDPDFLMYLVKPGEASTFGDMINLLDEMAICQVTSGHYAEVDITKEETAIMKEIE
jgi:biopolymer transport protein ExbD